jgi:hypothetical protein
MEPQDGRPYPVTDFCNPDSAESSQSLSNNKEAKLSLYFTNQAPGLEDLWRSGGEAPPFLTSALDAGE